MTVRIERQPVGRTGHVDYNFNYAPRSAWQSGDPLLIDVAVARRGGLKLSHVPVSITCLSIIDQTASAAASR